MLERENKIITTNEARAIGSFLALSVIVVANSWPEISSVIKKEFISGNTDDYSIVTYINGNPCYTDNMPTLSDSLQSTHLTNTYCPLGINGKTKFIELVIPTNTITSFPAGKK